VFLENSPRHEAFASEPEKKLAVERCCSITKLRFARTHTYTCGETRRTFRKDMGKRMEATGASRVADGGNGQRRRISATRRLDGIVNSGEELLNFSKRRSFSAYPLFLAPISVPVPLPFLSQPRFLSP